MVIGRLTADPDLRYTTRGDARGRFTLETERGGRVDVVLHGPLAVEASDWLRRGDEIHVRGYIMADGRLRGERLMWPPALQV